MRIKNLLLIVAFLSINTQGMSNRPIFCIGREAIVPGVEGRVSSALCAQRQEDEQQKKQAQQSPQYQECMKDFNSIQRLEQKNITFCENQVINTPQAA